MYITQRSTRHMTSSVRPGALEGPFLLNSSAGRRTKPGTEEWVVGMPATTFSADKVAMATTAV